MSEERIKCNVNETGVCALHNVEIERRKGEKEAIEKSIKALETAVSTLSNMIPKISRSFYVIIATATLMLIMVTGSYVYTRDAIINSINRDNSLQKKIETLTDKFNLILIENARTEGAQHTLLNEIKDFSKLMKEHLKEK